jgi:hypothetical protein
MTMPPDSIDLSLQFVPDELLTKCRRLIKRYHTTYGYSRLPDILWQSDVRAFIQAYKPLARSFNKGTKLRSAKRTNDVLVSVATSILALEVLARNFIGWGNKFPEAKQEAEQLFTAHIARSRACLLDTYVFRGFDRVSSTSLLALDR